MIRILFLNFVLFSSLCFSQIKPAQDFSAEKVKFTFMSSGLIAPTHALMFHMDGLFNALIKNLACIFL